MAARKKTTAQAPTAAPSPVRVVTKPGSEGFFTNVRSNVKGGVDTRLYACTAIVSERNRAGKTAVLDSIRLALTGQHPVGPHFADLCELTADGSAPEAVLDGPHATGTFHVPNGRKSGDHALTGALAGFTGSAAGLLPLSNLRDLLTLGTAKAREELFRRFGATGNIEVPDGLDESQLVVWTAALAASMSTDAAERLSLAGEYLRKQKRATSSEIRSLEEEAERLRAEQDPNGSVTDDVVADLREKLERHRRVAASQRLVAQRDTLKQDLNDGIEEYQRTRAPESKEEFEASLASLPTVAPFAAAKQAHEESKQAAAALPRANDLVQAVLNVREASVGLADGVSTTTCLCCTASVAVPTLLAAIERVKATHAAAEETRVAADKAFLRTRTALREAEEAMLQEQARERTAWQNRFNSYTYLRNRLQQLGDDYKRVVEALEAAVGGEVPAEDVPTLQARLDAVTKAKARRERLSAIVGNVRRAKNDLDDIKAVETVVGETLSTLIGGIALSAENAVNAWMPEGFKAKLVLDNAEGKPECRWQVVGSDGRSHPRGAASGAEWSALTVAIACAWSDTGDKNPRFLMLDDGDIAGFSAENVRNFLGTVSAAVADGRLTQAFVAWSRPHEIPTEGWGGVSV
jgi:DNA repair exonuclease SbcCD ATPase subunit